MYVYTYVYIIYAYNTSTIANFYGHLPILVTSQARFCRKESSVL